MPTIIQCKTKEYNVLVAVRDLGGTADIGAIGQRLREVTKAACPFPLLVSIVEKLTVDGRLSLSRTPAEDAPQGRAALLYGLTDDGGEALDRAESAQRRAVSQPVFLGALEQRVLLAMSDCDQPLDMKAIQRMFPERSERKINSHLSTIVRKFTQFAWLSTQKTSVDGRIQRLYRITEDGKNAYHHFDSNRVSEILRNSRFGPEAGEVPPASDRFSNSKRRVLNALLELGEQAEVRTIFRALAATTTQMRPKKMTMSCASSLLGELTEDGYLRRFRIAPEPVLGRRATICYQLTKEGRAALDQRLPVRKRGQKRGR
ncbi:MAG TPA: hypothetical protein VGZ00_03135 [Candidatus Baltobacteraceae bacterium]|jgi:DNA-binding PadR family transcriptional regulator|nr:hypothetical protein [Candidatus Baltobacteraceae bacterium]